jgi:hypothetical protein
MCLKNFLSKFYPCETPGFCRCAAETFAVLQYCTALLGSWLPTLRDGLSTPSSRVKKNKTGSPDKAVTKQQPTLSNIPEERMSQVLLFHAYRGFLLRTNSFLNKQCPLGHWKHYARSTNWNERIKFSVEKLDFVIFYFNVSHPVVFLKFIQDTNGSQTQQFYYIITFKATCFNSIESSAGLLENRSNDQHL